MGKKTSLSNYLKAFLYFFLITILFSFSTIVLHEIGHFIFGLISNCHSVRIVLFDTKFMATYTEMVCPPSTNIFLLGLSGSLIIVPLSLLLLFTIKGSDRYLGLIMLGFNLIVSLWDFENYLHLPYKEIYAIIGVIILILGEILLIEKSIF